VDSVGITVDKNKTCLSRNRGVLSLPLHYIDMAIVFNPKKKKRARKHGFLTRMSTPSGRKVILARRRKGRAELAV